MGDGSLSKREKGMDREIEGDIRDHREEGIKGDNSSREEEEEGEATTIG